MGAKPETLIYLLSKDVRTEFDKEDAVIGITKMGTEEYNQLVEKFKAEYDQYIVSEEQLSNMHLFIRIDKTKKI